MKLGRIDPLMQWLLNAKTNQYDGSTLPIRDGERRSSLSHQPLV